FIATSTSLPELVVSFAAAKRGALDMAIGNLFGSNLFNIGILAIDDFAYTKGPLLSSLKGDHIVTASAAIVMTAIAIIGLIYRSTGKRFWFGWDSIAVLGVFVLANVILFLLR